MPNTAISGLSSATPTTLDYVEILDVSDTTMGASGSNKKVLVSSLMSLASPDLSAYATTAYVVAGYQPLDSDLTAIAALTTTTFGRSLLTAADATALRTAAGLGTLATQSGTFSGTSSGTNTGDQDLSGYQPLDSDLTAIAALTTTTFGRSQLAVADAAAARALILAARTDGTNTFTGTQTIVTESGGGIYGLEIKVATGANGFAGVSLFNNAGDVKGRFLCQSAVGGFGSSAGSASHGDAVLRSEGQRVHLSADGSANLNLTVASTGRVGIYNTSPAAMLDIQSNSASVPVVAARGASGQIANLIEVTDDADAVLSAINKNGGWVPASMADATAVNGTMYYSTTAGKLVYKDSGGTVNNLY